MSGVTTFARNSNLEEESHERGHMKSNEGSTRATKITSGETWRVLVE